MIDQLLALCQDEQILDQELKDIAERREKIIDSKNVLWENLQDLVDENRSVRVFIKGDNALVVTYDSDRGSAHYELVKTEQNHEN